MNIYKTASCTPRAHAMVFTNNTVEFEVDGVFGYGSVLTIVGNTALCGGGVSVESGKLIMNCIQNVSFVKSSASLGWRNSCSQ